MSEIHPRTALPEYRDAIRQEIQAGAMFGDFERSIDQLADPASAAADPPLPLEFDNDGFPLSQRRPDFVTRVARLRDL